MLQMERLLSTLSDSHLSISVEDQRIVVLRFVGWSPEEIGSHLVKHPRTVYGRIEHVMSMFCAVAGLDYDIGYLAAFVRDHALCQRGCLKLGVAYVEVLERGARAGAQ